MNQFLKGIMANLKASFGRAVLFTLSVVVFGGVCVAQVPPVVEKVEPPSWWAGHSINPVRVLVRGRNLYGARVEAVGLAPATAAGAGDVGLRTGLVRVNERGTYLFLDVFVEPNARPGRRTIRLRGPVEITIHRR